MCAHRKRSFDMKILLIACVVLFTVDAGERAAIADAPSASITPAADLHAAVMPPADTTKGRPLKAELSGENEVPPADPDGAGMAKVTLNLGQQEVCYELSVENIAEATLAHIHSGAEGVNGPPVVTLDPPVSGSSSGCVSEVSKEVIQNILKSPSDYYVNVHNAEYPGGAVRGQLTKAKGKSTQ